ncbi:MAG TPA: hypothetical protein VKX34_10485 [Aequorivita sp.]|nr:hypothetical protein [Aequorivita sp.]
MFTNAEIERFKKHMVKDLVKGSIKELKRIKNPQDFTDIHSYNLIQMIFSFKIASGKSPETTKEELIEIVNQAYKDFLEQTGGNLPK